MQEYIRRVRPVCRQAGVAHVASRPEVGWQVDVVLLGGAEF
jgi:hypothetical protein